jgi:hypothetical protein
MLKLTFRPTFIILLLLALACIPVTYATLSPMSFGFPTMTQFASNTAFNKAAANAFDFETADISPFGSFGSPFPTIGQTEVQGQVINQCEFSQSTVFSAFSFPAVDTGLGFAGFGDFTGLGNLL